MKKFLIITIVVIFVLFAGSKLIFDNIPASQNIPPVSSKENNGQNTTSDSLEDKDLVGIKYTAKQGYLELPVNGATGYAPVTMNLRAESNNESNIITTMQKGSGFTIIEEFGDWWEIQFGEYSGYVSHDYCMINLPDILPSAVYNNTNSKSSEFKSSYKEIPHLTGYKLYDAHSYNERLQYDEYIMPVLYNTAKKIALAQESALADGNTLIIYELFRPYEVQIDVVNKLSALSQTDLDILNGISASPWSIEWFIATGVSSHQQGYAIDVSLGEVLESTDKLSGDYIYSDVTEYTEYQMPTPMHELSIASISMPYPVTAKNDIDWRTAPIVDTMNAEALLLREYCTNSGLTPLASEWWHFNDLEIRSIAKSDGKFYVDTAFSKLP